MAADNIVPHSHSVTAAMRSAIKGHRPAMLWFTGLSGSGKSTVANAVERLLHDEQRAHTYLLDGDNVRTGLCSDLGFSDAHRTENIRRLGELGRLFVDAGLIVLSAFISPFRADRALARELVGGDFLEIYVKCSLETCESRDPKGLYKKARAGDIPGFTGISSPYEEPDRPDILIDTGTMSVDECARRVVDELKKRGRIIS